MPVKSPVTRPAPRRLGPATLLLVPMLAGCAAGPEPAPREVTAEDAYVQQVERQARNSGSPVQVHWVHPPRAGQTRATSTRVWRWSDAPEEEQAPEPDVEADGQDR